MPVFQGGNWLQTNPFASNSKDQFDALQKMNDWQQRLKMQELQSQPVYKPGGSTGGAIADATYNPANAQAADRNNPVAARLAAVADPNAQTGVRDGGGNIAQNLRAASTEGPVHGKISDDMTPKPGMYYSDVTPDNILSLIQDPSQAMGYWAKFHGYNDAYASRLSSVYNINDLLRAMGIGGTQMAGTNELDWQGRLADRLSGRLKDSSGGGYDYLNPQSIASSIFATPRADLASGANSLATSINNPNLQPEQQISNVAQFVLGSLQGVLTNDQLNAYSQVLDQLATQFMRSYQTTPGGGAANRPTFLEYVRQNGGQYGGLF